MVAIKRNKNSTKEEAQLPYNGEAPQPYMSNHMLAAYHKPNLASDMTLNHTQHKKLLQDFDGNCSSMSNLHSNDDGDKEH